MNVIFVMIDTLRYDCLGANGAEWIRTPNLDRFAAESWVFDRYYAASFPTIANRLDVITGADGGPFHLWQPLAHGRPTLPRALATHGFATQLIHDTPHLVNGGHNFDWPFHAWTQIRGGEVDRPWIDALDDQWTPNWAFDPLFDFVASRHEPLHRHTQTYARANRRRRARADWNAAALFRTAGQFIEDNRTRDNFFLWVDCFDPHEPWDAPPEFVRAYDPRRDSDGTLDPRSFVHGNRSDMPQAAHAHIRAQYAAKTAWMDHCFGELLDALERTGLEKNTAVVVASDHGTRIGEAGTFGKGPPVDEHTGHCVLMARVPGSGAGRCEAILQPQDLWPTLCGAAGVPGWRALNGQDAVAVAEGRAEPARSIAVSGQPPVAWGGDPAWAFTVFDGTWVLEAGTTPERSRLRRADSMEEATADRPDLVQRLHAAGVDELERRGAPVELVSWMRAGADGPFPGTVRMYVDQPRPVGFAPYFQRLYEETR